ncbi:hypothetical protein NIBR502770_11755 [Pseudarthrobacter sp. NIBRBAC000502770]|nr:hypothetical protein NIBR502770_11755 [Pseudarthrobacter sp. NIBRBAC000502770]
MPDVTGKQFGEARKLLYDADFFGYPWGKDGKKWAGMAPDDAIVTSTVPAAGTVTDTSDIKINVNTSEAERLAAAKLAKRYEFICGGIWTSSNSDTYHSLKEVWASKSYSNADTCSVKIDGDYVDYSKPTLLPAEQAIVDIVAANGGDVSSVPAKTFDTELRLCAKPAPDFATLIWAKPEWKKAQAKAALALCPEAPHAAMLQEVVNTVKLGDGTHVVGKEMEPGTYRTNPSTKDCYWSRTTGGGNIIANDFVGFAPDGVTVTVYPGEGFESQRCGAWTKIG